MSEKKEEGEKEQLYKPVGCIQPLLTVRDVAAHTVGAPTLRPLLAATQVSLRPGTSPAEIKRSHTLSPAK